MTCCYEPDIYWAHHCNDQEDCDDDNENCHRVCSNCDSGLCEDC